MRRLIRLVFATSLVGCACFTPLHAAAMQARAEASNTTRADAPIDDYFTALATQLSTSRAPRDLYVAALLLDRVEVSLRMRRDLRERGSAGRSPVAEALMQRALDLGHDDPMLQWVAAHECPASMAVCDAPAAVRRLRKLAPNNAAAWVLPSAGNVLGSAQHGIASDERDEELRLQRIAASSRYDTYAGDRYALYHSALSRRPVPYAVRERLAHEGVVPRPSEVRAMLTQVLRGMGGEVQGLKELCSTSVLATSSPLRRDLCVAAAQRVVERADSASAHVGASRVLVALLPEGAARDALARESAKLQWQLQALHELERKREQDPEARPGPDPLVVKRWLEPGATALGVMRRTLRTAGIALGPPADWQAPVAVLWDAPSG
jgi:hypothetical protein